MKLCVGIGQIELLYNIEVPDSSFFEFEELLLFFKIS